MKRRDFIPRLTLTGIAAAASSSLLATLADPARAQGTPLEGKQYTKLDPPAPPFAPGKIEVVEFFSYACPHCNAFEPTLEAWAKNVPADVAFHRVPVPFLMNFENLMRTYYTLETLGQVEAMQRKVFTAIHVDRQFLDKPADIAALAQKNGIDPAKFTAAFNSFSVATSVARAKKMLTTYKIDSVPTLVVQGRYVTSPSMAGSSEQALATVDYLVQRARAKG